MTNINTIDYVPSNLQAVTIYNETADNLQYVMGQGEIQLALTYDDAVTGTAIEFTDEGSGKHSIRNTLSSEIDTFTADTDTNILSLGNLMDLGEGATVRLSTDGTLPDGLEADTTYYAIITVAWARYIDIRNKYRDFLSLDNEIVQKIISEQGYDYIASILELMTLGNQASKVFLGYIGIVHLLKGNRRGLELVFGLLDLDYTLTEWWEKSPQGTPDTFDMTVEIDMTEYTFEDVDLFDTGIQNFVRQYVYPIFDEFAINATLAVQGTYYVGAAAIFGEEITVQPPIIITVSTQSAAPYVAAILIMSETIAVNPP